VGNIFKPGVTRPLPPGAKIVDRNGKRIATWTDSKGKKRQGEVTHSDPPRLRQEASVYHARFRDGGGALRQVSTGCKSRDAAQAVLAGLQRRAEQVRAGTLTAAESTVADRVDTPVAEHIDAYISHLSRKHGRGARPSTSKGHVENVRRDLTVAVAECRFERLRGLNREAVAAWVSRLRSLPDSATVDGEGNVLVPCRPAPRTINARLASLTAWGNWLVDSRRVLSNPFARLGKTAGVEAGDDIRRKRRAFTEGELLRLIAVARLRPVAEYGRSTVKNDTKPEQKKSRATWKREELSFATVQAAAERGRTCLKPEVLSRLEHSGRERALLYAVLVTTGLRKGELTALTLDDVVLDEGSPAIMLPAVHAKSGKAARLPLRADVAGEVRAWVAEKFQAGESGTARLFNVPTKLAKILYRDLQAADIPRRDKRGRIVDVHAMRGTFGTHLARAGVDPVTLKTLMRHGRIETTMKFYVDDSLLETDEAVAKLPAVFANSSGTGLGPTTKSGTRAVALDVALAPGRSLSPVSLCGTCDDRIDCDAIVAKALHVADSATKAGETEGWLTGLEPATPRITI